MGIFVKLDALLKVKEAVEKKNPLAKLLYIDNLDKEN